MQKTNKLLTLLLLIFCCLSYQKAWSQIENENQNSEDDERLELVFACDPLLTIHPNDADFMSTSPAGLPNNNIGKMLIWRKPGDNNYHTPYQEFTPVYDSNPEPYGVVRIEVKFTSESDQPVYFKVIDFDDESPYETSTDPIDNEELISAQIGLIAQNMNAQIASEILTVTATGSGLVKTAVAYLRMTKRYSGDNYKVLASLNSGLVDTSLPYPGVEEIVETSNLVAWKRGYIEFKEMLSSGSFISQDTEPESDFIRVNHLNDIIEGSQIRIFNNNGDVFVTTVQDIPSGSPQGSEKLILADLLPNGISFPEYSGVHISNNINTLGSLTDNTKKRIQDGFGFFGNGDDTLFDNQINADFQNNDNSPSGGAFVEFQYFESDDLNYRVPKFQNSATTTQFRLSAFLDYWNNYAIVKPSIFLGVLGFNFEGSILGKGFDSINSFAVFQQNVPTSPGPPPVPYTESEIANTFVHELGHQLGIGGFGNEDNHVEVIYFGPVLPNDLNDEMECIMSYGTHSNNTTAEFDSHHNNLENGTGLLENSCIGDIRRRLWPEY